MSGRVPWVHLFVDLPPARSPDAQRFWSRVTGWPVGPPWPQHPEFVSLEPSDGAEYVHLQQIDGPGRVHVDLVVADIDGEAVRLTELGAVPGVRRDRWQVMASPGGLPFCLVAGDVSAVRPGPATWPGGHRSRVAQVCIDVPPAVHAEEWTFWLEATGWAHEAVRRDEFEGLLPPDGCPLRLLIQRLGPGDGADRVTAHLDLGTSDVTAEVDRIRRLGATVVDDSHPWTVLRDGSGLAFCVTPRSPD